jgi:hypothetical protein
MATKEGLDTPLRLLRDSKKLPVRYVAREIWYNVLIGLYREMMLRTHSMLDGPRKSARNERDNVRLSEMRRNTSVEICDTLRRRLFRRSADLLNLLEKE